MPTPCRIQVRPVIFSFLCVACVIVAITQSGGDATLPLTSASGLPHLSKLLCCLMIIVATTSTAHIVLVFVSSVCLDRLLPTSVFCAVLSVILAAALAIAIGTNYILWHTSGIIEECLTVGGAPSAVCQHEGWRQALMMTVFMITAATFAGGALVTQRAMTFLPPREPLLLNQQCNSVDVV